MSAADDTTPRRELPTRAEVLATLDYHGAVIGLASSWVMCFDSGKRVDVLIRDGALGLDVWGVGPLSKYEGTNIQWQRRGPDGAAMPWSQLAELVAEAQGSAAHDGQEMPS